MTNNTSRKIYANEFNWLGYCTSCNIDCCHNTNKSIPEYECIKSGIEKYHMTDDVNAPATKLIDRLENTYDNRPLECQIFPFDIMESDGRLEWIRWNKCHATPKLHYEKFMDFFERQFSKRWSLEQIQKYVEQNKLINPKKYLSNDFERIREVKWQDL
jgi:hypothetical protein